MPASAARESRSPSVGRVTYLDYGAYGSPSAPSSKSTRRSSITSFADVTAAMDPRRAQAIITFCDAIKNDGQVCRNTAAPDDEVNIGKCGVHRRCHGWVLVQVDNGVPQRQDCQVYVHKGHKLCVNCTSRRLQGSLNGSLDLGPSTAHDDFPTPARLERHSAPARSEHRAGHRSKSHRAAAAKASDSSSGSDDQMEVAAPAPVRRSARQTSEKKHVPRTGNGAVEEYSFLTMKNTASHVRNGRRSSIDNMAYMSGALPAPKNATATVISEGEESATDSDPTVYSASKHDAHKRKDKRSAIDWHKKEEKKHADIAKLAELMENLGGPGSSAVKAVLKASGTDKDHADLDDSDFSETNASADKAAPGALRSHLDKTSTANGKVNGKGKGRGKGKGKGKDKKLEVIMNDHEKAKEVARLQAKHLAAAQKVRELKEKIRKQQQADDDMTLDESTDE